jgi:hypothetical protein
VRVDIVVTYTWYNGDVAGKCIKHFIDHHGIQICYLFRRSG